MHNMLTGRQIDDNELLPLVCSAADIALNWY